MIKSFNFTIVIMLTGHFGMSSLSAKESLTELQKIDALIHAIEVSRLKFVRGTSEYAANDAASHLRMKWGRAGKGRIDTADKFIKYIATKSSLLGTPYYIQLKNGRRIRSAIWLKTRLSQLNSTQK